MKLILPKKVNCMIPENSGACASYAQSECFRLLKKLGIAASITGYNKGLTLNLGTDDRIPASVMKKVCNNGFVSNVTKSGVTLAAKTEKGLLNAVYTLAEDLGITFLMPGEENEFLAPGAPFSLECGVQVRNMRSRHAGLSCEFAAVTKEEYSGEEWMAYFAKMRLDRIHRHAGGHICNDPKFGFIYGNGNHEFHHLLSKEFKEKHPETSRQNQPDDFGGQRVNDVNFCSASATAWQEIERNFRKYASGYKELDHLILEFADLPGGGYCMCAHCRNYSTSDIQAIVMNRFAEIVEKLGLKCTIQMNAYHDTMLPSKMFPPRNNIMIKFCPRERCWGHALDDPHCDRNAYYLKCLKEWEKYAFPYVNNIGFGAYYNDQILFRGMYPFIPDVISADLNCVLKHGVTDFMTLQVGGQILQPDYNLLYFSAVQWDHEIDKKKFCKNIARRIAGNLAPALEKYLLERTNIFSDVLKWCDVDLDICHLDYRWLKEDDSKFFREMADRLHKDSVAMKNAALALKNSMAKAPSVLKKILIGEVMRAEFESEVMEGMSLQQAVNVLMPEVRRTRNPEKAAVCRKKFKELQSFLRKSVKTGDKAGLGKNAYYGRFVDPWLMNDISQKIEWCDSILHESRK